ncbi:hypothetical protein [Verrucomicrobium sp. BvORR034]|uniref:hypothetical protein n=1 Tax=Verrucomicrobium sp. BvORR034 TaxID=1396418 RepID=UPI002240F318|nr:hypothetical protein [Verrucomicrobium sp. BvORR034]
MLRSTALTRWSFHLLMVGVAAWCGQAVAEGQGQIQEPPATPWKFEEIRRVPAAEAKQGVAVDESHFYVIDNRTIGKYRLDNGERVARWEGPKGGPLTHLNAGIVRDGKLYCAHSNFPSVPTVSSVEIWDTATLKHVGSHSFGHFVGSLTWVDFKDGFWYACFAQYAKTGAEPGKDPSFTEVIKFDDQWRRLEGWVFPAALVAKFGGNSSSGGGFGPEGQLFITGHDARELYQIAFPEAGSELIWTGTLATTFPGQAFAWQHPGQGLLFAIDRGKREVVAGRVVKQP